jgi:hypothetical protein
MTKRTERKLEIGAGHVSMNTFRQDPPFPGRGLAFLTLPLPRPDYWRTPRWPGKESPRPGVVLYLVDYTVGPKQWDEKDLRGQTWV